MRAWLTPSTLPSATRRVSLLLPDDPAYLAALRGAALLLADADNWELFGAVTPQEAASAFAASWDSLEWGDMLGSVLYWPGETVPAWGLLCDGSQILINDYPELYAVIGDNFGSADPDYFRLPALDQQFIRSEIDPSWGVSGGQDTVTLTEAEMPVHSHPTHSHTHAMKVVYLQVALGDWYVYAPSAEYSQDIWPLAPINVSVRNTGGGQAHENRPSYQALKPIIVAR